MIKKFFYFPEFWIGHLKELGYRVNSKAAPIWQGSKELSQAHTALLAHVKGWVVTMITIPRGFTFQVDQGNEVKVTEPPFTAWSCCDDLTPGRAGEWYDGNPVLSVEESITVLRGIADDKMLPICVGLSPAKPLLEEMAWKK